MFAIGEKTTEVNKSRVAMPVEYHLRKRKIYGTWVGPDLLYISDEVGPLKVKKEAKSLRPMWISGICSMCRGDMRGGR